MRGIGIRIITALLVLTTCREASAQGMGQGEASIKVRSDVTMGIRGTRGTPKARLQALADVLMGRMDAVRGCYREVVAKRPATVGAFAIEVVVDGSASAKLSIKEEGGSDPQLKRCVARRMAQARFGGIPRPAAAIVTLRFENSRAEGQAAFEQAQEQLDEVAVVDGEDGARRASWGTSDGRLLFEARARSGAQRDEAVTAVIRAIRDGYAPFLDCRRRAGKKGHSHLGTIDVKLRLAAKGRADVDLDEVSLTHERAPACARRALGKLRFEGAPAGTRVELKITYAD